MKQAAVYIRVSTEEQAEYSPDAQLKAAREYAAKNGLVICPKHIYIDEGISGKSTRNRQAFNRMIGAAKEKPKPFAVILLWKFSRFARNREDSIVYKSMLRRQLGIEVLSVTEKLGDDKMSILIEALIEAMDEYYSINLAEEVKKGMTEKAGRGEFQASPPFGYRKPAGEPLQIEPKEAPYVQYAFEQFLKGESCFAIAKKLNALGVRTKRGNKIERRMVEYLLNNPVYKGYVRWTPGGKTLSKRIFNSEETILVKSNHVPIIEESLFDAVKERMKKKDQAAGSKTRPKETKKHYLSGLIRCGSCGSALVYSQAHDGFQCSGYSRGICQTSHYIQRKRIEDAILKSFDRLAFPDLYIKMASASSNQIEKKEFLSREIADAERRLVRARQAYISGADSLKEYSNSKEALQQTIINMKTALTKLCSEELLSGDTDKEKEMTMSSILTNSKWENERSTALTEVVEKIIYYRAEDKIDLYLCL